MAGIPWTEEEEQLLREGVEKGLTTKQLLLVLKSRTKTAIENKAAQLGISLQVGKPEIDREAYRRFTVGR